MTRRMFFAVLFAAPVAVKPDPVELLRLPPDDCDIFFNRIGPLSSHAGPIIDSYYYTLTSGT